MQMMNDGPMKWQFGDDQAVTEQPDANDNHQPASRTGPARRRRTWLVIFLVALAASWTTGFYLGRVQQTTTLLEAQIQGRLDVESWAWQQGDWDLFRSLLPPRTPGWRLETLQTMFYANAPEPRDMKLTDYVVRENGGRVDATARVSVADQQYEIERTYRLLDGRWRLVRLAELDGDTARR